MILQIRSKCSVCGKLATEKFTPFCSSRCANLDLGRWLGEGYKIPVADDDPEEADFLPISGGNEE